MTVKWEDPPAPTRIDYTEVLGELKTRPGDWALVRQFPAGSPARLAHSTRQYLQKRVGWAGQTEVRAAKTKVYARYVGD